MFFQKNTNMSGEGAEQESYYFTPPIGPDMKAEIPEIEEYTRIAPYRSFIAVYNDKTIKLTDVCYADTSFFDIFTFTLVRGNPQNALVAPFVLIGTAVTGSSPICVYIKTQMFVIVGCMSLGIELQPASLCQAPNQRE